MTIYVTEQMNAFSFFEFTKKFGEHCRPTSITTLTPLHLQGHSIGCLHENYSWFGRGISVGTIDIEKLKDRSIIFPLIAPKNWFITLIARPGDSFNFPPLQDRFSRKKPSCQFHFRYCDGAESGHISVYKDTYDKIISYATEIKLETVQMEAPPKTMLIERHQILPFRPPATAK